MSAPALAPATALTRALGQSGRHYLVERLLQERPGYRGRVYLATSVCLGLGKRTTFSFVLNPHHEIRIAEIHLENCRAGQIRILPENVR